MEEFDDEFTCAEVCNEDPLGILPLSNVPLVGLHENKGNCQRKFYGLCQKKNLFKLTVKARLVLTGRKNLPSSIPPFVVVLFKGKTLV